MTNDLIQKLGPLGGLVGTWEGDQGVDTAPDPNNQTKDTLYREKIVFEPFGPVNNHTQELYALRYKTTAWPKGQNDPFHEELGYWLWDAREKQVIRCFMVPRGVTINAGGTSEPNAKNFKISATSGQEVYGVLSNPYLDREVKTVKYELEVTIQDDGTMSYHEDTQLQIKALGSIFHHTDKNTLKKVN